MKKIHTTNTIILLFLLATCATAVQAQTPTPTVSPTPNTTYYVSTARQKDKMKQDFPYDIDLKTTEGTLINSSKLFQVKDKPLVVLFWLTTCYPCRMELQAIKDKYDAWQKETKFSMIALSYDFPHNYDNFVKRVKEEGWQFEAYNDVNKEFGEVLPGELNGLPQVFVFDKDGKIAYHKRKYMPGDEDILYAKVKELAQ
jgi:cytochrome c biogenesis protein CcmG, thiol:disulfide interchange protein DsbE